MPLLYEVPSDILQIATENLCIRDKSFDFQYETKIRFWRDRSFFLKTKSFNRNKKILKKIDQFVKEYPGAPFFSFTQGCNDIHKVLLVDCIERRSTQRQFVHTRCSWDEVSTIINWSNGIKNKNADSQNDSHHELLSPHSYRLNPSGGRRYPLELYVFSQNIDHLPVGFFHYNIKRKGLELMKQIDDQYFFSQLFNQEKKAVENASFAILITAVSSRSAEKYGTFSYPLILLEAGHLAQSLWLVATGLDFKCWPISIIDDNLFYKQFHINPYQERFVLSMIFGK